MPQLVRFGVSLEKNLFDQFSKRIQQKSYTNRSEALRDLIREDLVRVEWQEGNEVAGAITLVYDHHKRDLLNRLMDVQHDHHTQILSTQHIHLDHHNCLEVVVAKGTPQDVQELYGKLKSLKGVRHASIAMSTMGKVVV
jgi:CopG family transcriptional regulator, nickel-responsive regulator